MAVFSHRKTQNRGVLVDLVDSRTWPEHLLLLARAFDGPERDRARAEFWLLLNLALAQRLRILSVRLYRLDRESIQDLASEKALDLVRKLDCGHWNPLESTAGELVSYLSTIARNAIVDELRRAKRAEPDSSGRDETRSDDAVGHRDTTGHEVERKEFVSQLVDCAEKLNPRHRVIWLLRIFHDLSSKAIAGHPEVRLKASHVDVILGRCRDRIRMCMSARGLDARELPPGTFTELWRRFRANPILSEVSDD